MITRTATSPSLRAAVFTADGGVRQGEADLWCTYAAIRTVRWLGRRVPVEVARAAAEYLLARRNNDGGFAWSRGLRSDIWATYYCTQALSDLGVQVPECPALAEWLGTLRNPDGGFGMTRGQPSDVWATYYAIRTHRDILGPVPRPEEATSWLGQLYTPDGGLTWQPGHGEPDVRAAYYAVHAAHALPAGHRAPEEWDREQLVGWLRARQRARGGFSFTRETEPCLWATYRALGTLDQLSAQPASRESAVRWILDRRLPGGGFARWEGYPYADVWAVFCAAGALHAVCASLDPVVAQELIRFLLGCQVDGGGFTYREADHAGDALATAAALLLEPWWHESSGPLARWLQHAHLPYEGGVMYMPGRGAEVRCTLWATSALRHARFRQLDGNRIAAWFTQIQNADGGYGYWHGRGSDMVATASVLDALDELQRFTAPGVDDRVASFVRRCRAPGGFAFVPGDEATAAATAQGIRALALLGRPLPVAEAANLLAGFASPLGGFAGQPQQPPDLVSTFQVVRTQQVVGIALDRSGLRRFLARIRQSDGAWAWSVIGTSGGILADCLGHHLARAVNDDRRLPALNL